MDRKQTIQVLSILRAAYPSFYRGMSKPELENIVDLWSAMFADDRPDLVAAAVKSFVVTDTKGYPPHIGVIKDKMRLFTTPEAMTEQEAWGLVRKALSNSLYHSDEEYNALPRLIQSLVGSPSQLKEWALMDESTVQSVVASNFMRSYRARAKHQEEFDALPEDVKQIAIEAGYSFSMGRALEG